MQDMGNLNQLPPEIKVLIVNGQSLVDETRRRVKDGGADLVGKMQLRDDCAAIEKEIKKLGKGKYKQKDIEGLKLAIIRLQTTSKGILKE